MWAGVQFNRAEKTENWLIESHWTVTSQHNDETLTRLYLKRSTKSEQRNKNQSQHHKNENRKLNNSEIELLRRMDSYEGTAYVSFATSKDAYVVNCKDKNYLHT